MGLISIEKEEFYGAFVHFCVERTISLYVSHVSDVLTPMRRALLRRIPALGS